MHFVKLAAEDDFTGWRAAARTHAANKIPVDHIIWHVGERAPDMFACEALPSSNAAATAVIVPREFVHLAQRVILHSAPNRFALLYTLLLRLFDQPRLLEDRTDELVHRVMRMQKTVQRDIHKMRAFVRFREVAEGENRRFVAWYEPEHYIVRANASFFIGRFANMRWSILTPLGSIHWDGGKLDEGPAATRPETVGDPLEEIWKAYYAATFNPARVMPDAMRKEMPKKYWKNMPETALIPELLAGARRRESEMIERVQVWEPKTSS